MWGPDSDPSKRVGEPRPQAMRLLTAVTAYRDLGPSRGRADLTAGTKASQQFELESIWTGPSGGGEDTAEPGALSIPRRAAPLNKTRDHDGYSSRGPQPY